MDDVAGSQESSLSYSGMPMEEKMVDFLKSDKNTLFIAFLIESFLFQMSNLDMENMDEESKDSQGMPAEFMSSMSSDIPVHSCFSL